MPTPRKLPALVVSTLAAFAAVAPAAAFDEGLLEPEPPSVQRLSNTAQPYTGAAAPHSFSQLAQTPTSEALQQPSDNLSATYRIGDAPSDPYSMTWLALSGVAAATLAARKYRSHIPPWFTSGNPSAITRPPLWHDDESDAQGWRLSRIDELPEQHFTPLYSSLDDTDTRSAAKVIPIHRARITPSRHSTFSRTAFIDPSIIDVEPKPIKR